MKIVLYRVTIFVAVCLLAALVGWIGGYNFDTRGPNVALGLALTLIAAGIGAGYPFQDDKAQSS